LISKNLQFVIKKLIIILEVDEHLEVEHLDQQKPSICNQKIDDYS